MPYPSRIYLSGFMGSGKSTIGPILANVLGYDFVDLDDAIAREAGRSIPAIFAGEGEVGFRAREAEALGGTLERERLVVALGGGALAQPGNASRLARGGTVVHLHVEPERLVQRLFHSPTPRPLILGDDGEKLPLPILRARIDALLEARAATYAQAHLTVDVGALRLGSAVDAVERALRRAG